MSDTGPSSASADPVSPGRIATGVPIFKSLTQHAGTEHRSAALKTDALPIGHSGAVSPWVRPPR